MDKEKNKEPNNRDSVESNMLSSSKTRDSFIQNPDRNKEIHKEALGRNTKR